LRESPDSHVRELNIVDEISDQLREITRDIDDCIH